MEATKIQSDNPSLSMHNLMKCLFERLDSLSFLTLGNSSLPVKVYLGNQQLMSQLWLSAVAEQKTLNSLEGLDLGRNLGGAT